MALIHKYLIKLKRKRIVRRNDLDQLSNTIKICVLDKLDDIFSDFAMKESKNKMAH